MQDRTQNSASLAEDLVNFKSKLYEISISKNSPGRRFREAVAQKPRPSLVTDVLTASGNVGG